MADVLKTSSGRVRKKTGYHHGDLRNAIIEAVAKLIAKSHSLDFQLKEVGKMVGTSVPAIYRHFESKQDLLVETAIAGYVLQENYRSYALDQAGDMVLSRLLAVGYAYVHFARSHPGYFLLMKSMETEEILSSETYQAQRYKTIRLMDELVTECSSEGYFTDVEKDLVLAVLQAAAFGIANLYTADQLRYVAPGLIGQEDVVARLFKISLRAVLSEAGMRAVETVAGDPFQDIPNKPE
ncbi:MULTISPECIES: TetR/AcrR family transcriptional regulator [Hyphomonas]|uniref:TetR/AcrR family transcriptional regulator n=1 Tax=Hyphomonas TaxID=85 RepID=UPI002352C98F|nr:MULTISPECIES: TetR/AcrR family transcriptional regulator [Hyphomonas]|tara:strand:- start:3141 stop:3854 length:714 start_codon:yes stop_codon:yes gene_type:complete